MHLSRILTVADLPEHELPVDRVDWVIRGLAKCARTQQHLRPMAANLKNGIQYQGGFSCQVWLLATRYWSANRTANASYMTKWASAAYQLMKSDKEFTSEVVYKLATVSLKVCVQFWPWCVHKKPSTATVAFTCWNSNCHLFIRKIHITSR